MTPNFTGVWRVNQGKSAMRMALADPMIMKIDHREPAIAQEILFRNAEGAERHIRFRCQAGTEVAKVMGGMPARTFAHWEGPELSIETWVKTPEREMHFKDYWSISADCATLTMAHRDDDLAGQITVLDRCGEGL